MYERKKWVEVFLLIGLLSLIGCIGSPAQAFVMISEVLADPPPAPLGDANLDGVVSSSNDEFVEILNFGTSAVDISGWSLSDISSTRHIFPTQTILNAYEFLVVFGGGVPNLPAIHWQLASAGTLSLNNTNETISLRNHQGNLIDQVSYTTLASRDQSITRFPDGENQSFVLHSTLNDANGRLFSSGTKVDGKPFESTTVPDLPGSITFFCGVLGLIWVQCKHCFLKLV